MNKYIKYFITLILSLLLLSGNMFADDKELFMGTSSASKVKPNVMVLIDSSGSMRNIITYPETPVVGVNGSGYKFGHNYSGNKYGSTGWNSYRYTSTHWQGYWLSGTSLYDRKYKMQIYEVNGDSIKFYIYYGSKPSLASGNWFFQKSGVAKFSSVTYTGRSGSYYYYKANLSDVKDEIKNGEASVKNTSQKFVYAKLYGSSADGYVVYNNYYLRWIFIHATDEERAAVSHFSDFGTFDPSVKPPKLTDSRDDAWKAWWISDCDDGSENKIKYRFTRIQVARDVVCKLTEMSNEKVYMGLFRFNGGNGGYKLSSLKELDNSTTNSLKGTIYGVPANSSTPLAETLADIWSYYKPGSDYDVYYGAGESSDIKWWCQNNYTILMTDGEPTSDGLNDSKYNGSIFNSASYKRVKPYTTWKDWDPADGWGDLDTNGSLYLDDVAYFIRHQDMYPDLDNGGPFPTDSATGWPNEQNIITYTIGFTIDNQVLKDTAKNGDGEYYTASNYETLIEAFQSVITSILIREFAFSSITAPRRTSTAANDEVNTSYFGYFKPAASSGIWEGHLIAYPVLEKWGYDVDGDGTVESTELQYDTKDQCIANSGTQKCAVSYSYGVTPLWDAATKMPSTRKLYTLNASGSLIQFDTAYKGDIIPQMSSAFDANPDPGGTSQSQYEENVFTQIHDKIKQPYLADIFHSDVQYVGSPPKGKLYTNAVQILGAINPRDAYETYTKISRNRMVYTGTNDGVLHAFYADGSKGGEEAWGFIPKEVLPSLYNIAVKSTHTYTVDGRITVDDIYDHGGSGWRTYLYHGLRDGGTSYHAMNITTGATQPDPKWSFSDPVFSGKSWGRPIVGRIKYSKTGGTAERHVVVLSGGMGFNNGNSSDQKGKAMFIVDAITGDLLWMIGYDKTKGDNGMSNGELNTNLYTSSGATQMLVSHDEFNYPVPSAIAAIDSNNDGYLDTLYFGNTGGHMFKVDISSLDNTNWKAYLMYKHTPTEIAKTTISNVIDTILTVGNTSAFEVGHLIQGSTSKAMGYITEITSSTKLNVKTLDGTFQKSESIVTNDMQPLFVEPAIAYDNCDKLWITFGSGNRNRPSSDPTSGRYFAIMDNGNYANTTSTLTQLKWKTDGSYTFQDATIDTKLTNGWYFNFPDASNREKLHDPAPVIVPDSKLIPHVLFNTYQPPTSSGSSGSVDNPCAAPDEGSMKIYDIQLVYCGLEEDGVEVKVTSGRIAGGGMVGKRYLNMMGGSSVGGTNLTGNAVYEPSVVGSIIFWKERKR